MTAPGRRNGFTLIELLVVIAIIAMLAGILIPVVSTAIRKGKETAARTQMSSILNAIKQYQTEYGKLPVWSKSPNQQGASDVFYDNDGSTAEESKWIIKALMAEDDRSPMQANGPRNPRKIVFLEPPGSDLDGTYLDPYGTQYVMVLDTDYDGLIEHPFASPTVEFKTPAIIISAGEDMKLDTEDDIATHEPKQ